MAAAGLAEEGEEAGLAEEGEEAGLAEEGEEPGALNSTAADAVRGRPSPSCLFAEL